MKRLPLVLTLVALVALAASIAYWILQLYQPPQRPLAAAPIVAAPEPSMDAAATLFGGQPTTVATNFQLTGVISAGAQGVAILAASGEPAKALMIGKEIAPGVTLAEVHPRYVMLSDGGVMKRIDLATDTKAAAPMGAPVQQPAAGALAPAAAPGSPEAVEAEAAHPPSPGEQEQEQAPPAAAIPAPPPANAPAVPSAANPPISAGAVPQPAPAAGPAPVPGAAPATGPATAPATVPPQMPSPTRSPGSPVSQPPSSR